MTGRLGLGVLLLSAIVVTSSEGPALGQDDPMRPPLFELVRVLKATQNGLAYGDEAALKASAAQAEVIAGWLDHATRDDWRDQRNVRALAVYLLGGGGIGSSRKLLEESEFNEGDRELVDGALTYSVGRVAEAADALKKFDPLKLEPILGAHVALAQATQLIDTDPKGASQLLAQSALLAPGTLIDEASLRRRVVIAASGGKPRELSQLIESYARRFDKSVYRPALVATIQKVLAARDIESSQDMEELTAAVSWLTDAEQTRIVLQLAEGSIRLGRLELAQKAAERAVVVASGKTPERVRAVLYQTLSHVFLDKAGNSKAAFDGVERHKLSADDEMLLEVAMRFASSITAAIGTESVQGAVGGGDIPVIVTKARAMLADADKLIGRS